MILAQHDLVAAQRQTQAKLDALLAQQANTKKAKQHIAVPNFIKVYDVWFQYDYWPVSMINVASN